MTDQQTVGDAPQQEIDPTAELLDYAATNTEVGNANIVTATG